MKGYLPFNCYSEHKNRFFYDELNQLIREDNTYKNKTYVYTYDNAGNITSKKTHALTSPMLTPSSPTDTYQYGYTDSEWGDKLTSYRGQTITYDAIGNPLSYYNGSSYTFTWTNGRQLARAVKGNSNITFEYNSDGIRTSKTVGSVEHVYYLNGSQIIAEIWGNNMCIYLYDNDGSPIGFQYRTTSYDEGVFDTFWFTKNVQGDIVSVYNSSGTKLLTYHYDAWGNVTSQWHTYYGSDYYASYNPFKYRGYYHDSETGFYYLNSRYYDPATGRFLNADGLISTGQGLLGYNMFAYCNNNPVNATDSYGNNPNFNIVEKDNNISIELELSTEDLQAYLDTLSYVTGILSVVGSFIPDPTVSKIVSVVTGIESLVYSSISKLIDKTVGNKSVFIGVSFDYSTSTTKHYIDIINSKWLKIGFSFEIKIIKISKIDWWVK